MLVHSLASVKEAMAELRVSKTFLYKLPKNTPGVYRFGRSLRFSVEELRAWARDRATQKEETQV